LATPATLEISIPREILLKLIEVPHGKRFGFSGEVEIIFKGYVHIRSYHSSQYIDVMATVSYQLTLETVTTEIVPGWKNSDFPVPLGDRCNVSSL
jgi:hypothetical protein